MDVLVVRRLPNEDDEVHSATRRAHVGLSSRTSRLTYSNPVRGATRTSRRISALQIT